jgi:hypothetical protein
MSIEISILLPTYNGELYLRPQLDSILGQTYRDFELLICDDGSTDASVSIVEEYAGRDSRIRVQRQLVNLGQRAALGRLLPLARSSLIAFSDQDDVWHPEKLARLKSGIGESALAYGSSHLIDSEGREMGSALLDHMSVRLEGSDNVKFLLKNSVSGQKGNGRAVSILDVEALRLAHSDDCLLCGWRRLRPGGAHLSSHARQQSTQSRLRFQAREALEPLARKLSGLARDPCHPDDERRRCRGEAASIPGASWLGIGRIDQRRASVVEVLRLSTPLHDDARTT